MAIDREYEPQDPAVSASLMRNAHWLLRGALASVFIYHGIDKFLGPGISGFAGMMGFPWLLALLVALAEVGAGIFVILGPLVRGPTGSLISRLGALGMIGVMFGAIFMVHWGQWHFAATSTHPMGGMQFQVTLLLLAIYIFIKGNDA